MKRYIISLILGVLVVSLSAQTNQQLLQQLDQTIAQKQRYQARRLAAADSLSRLANTLVGEARIGTLVELFLTYQHFQSDSTLATLQRIKALPDYQSDKTLQQQIQLREAQVYGMMGLYSDAFRLMQTVDLQGATQDTRLIYYNAKHSVLGWMSEYAQSSIPSLARELKAQAVAYHDSILALEPDSLNRCIVQSNYDYDRGLYEKSVQSLLQTLPFCDPGQRIYIYSNLAQSYQQLGREEESMHYLILTAIADIQAGVTEYMALPLLAEQLNRRGDVDRAYNYLYCALEDANLCKASLRAMEVSGIFPIIHEARQKQLLQERIFTICIIALLVSLAVALLTIVFSLLRMNRKLKSIRLQLSEANNKLIDNNKQLLLIDAHKSEYLKSYLTRSRQYLASAESFQHQMLNLLQTRHLDELQKQLKSTKWSEEEEVRFYNDFDMVFLNLYPNFVEKFNALLRPDSQIVLKKGELLTTELRIFALIRMGETDSARIAKFLNYSLTTIYNYRSRIRNNALGDKERFEEEVAAL